MNSIALSIVRTRGRGGTFLGKVGGLVIIDVELTQLGNMASEKLRVAGEDPNDHLHGCPEMGMGREGIRPGRPLTCQEQTRLRGAGH